MTSFLSQAAALLTAAEKNRHRVLIVLAGEQLWGEQQATDLLEHQAITPLWVSDKPARRLEAIDLNSSRRWLGREVDTLVFDTHAGFDPNVFALLCGTVRAGGALILLTPALASWELHEDPVNARCSVWGQPLNRSRYLHRLAALIPSTVQLLMQQDKSLNAAALEQVEQETDPYAEQTELVRQIAERYEKNSPLLAVVSGDRGRGKSAALGQLTATLVHQGARQILLSAPRKAAAEVVMQHARKCWPEHAPALEDCLRFLPPDHLCLQPLDCDALLVDEMGGVHLGLLSRLLTLYPRLIMAGTVHGYEGAGRGFHTRLRQHIHEQYPYCFWSKLEQPIRWAAHDPLEHSCNTLLMLDAEVGEADAAGETEFSLLDRDMLAADEQLLRQIYGLLASAHYRTRPLDLRQMLDGPNIRIAVQRSKKTVLAACLIAQEGPIHDTELCQQIMAGKRRPSGHLLPQLLLQRLQLRAAANATYWRIVRIAVQPSLQNQGLGSKLLHAIEQAAITAQADCIGSVFAVNSPVFRFWEHADFQPVLLGDNCEATSGSYALTVLKPLSQVAQSLVTSARDDWCSSQGGSLAASHPALSTKLTELLERSKRPDKNPE